MSGTPESQLIKANSDDYEFLGVTIASPEMFDWDKSKNPAYYFNNTTFGFIPDETIEKPAVELWVELNNDAAAESGYAVDKDGWVYVGSYTVQSGKTQYVDNLLRLIDGGAQVAIAQSLFIKEVAECLRVEQCISGSIDKRQEVIVSRVGITTTCPGGSAVEISTNGEYDRCLGHHRLVEMGWRQLRLHLVRAGDDYTVELQVAHGLCACSLIH